MALTNLTPNVYHTGVHHIQRKILQQLFYSQSLGYAELRPKNVESNHFAYHLDQLVKTGLITKHGRKYTLSSEGLTFADRTNHQSTDVRKQAHIVTTLFITNSSGQVALSRHSFQPYLGLLGFPQGRTHYGEHIQQAAARELREKTGLTDIGLTHRGMAYVRTDKDGISISNILCHVFSGTATSNTPLSSENPQKTSPGWHILPPAPAAGYMPGFWDIKQLLDSHTASNLFFAEIEASLDPALPE